MEDAALADASSEEFDLTAPAAGRPLRVVLLTFYNYFSHALRIFHPLLKQRGHEVHSVFFKDGFTFGHPSQRDEDMALELIERIRPDLVGVCVWSTYYKLAARLSARIKERTGAVVVWGGIHGQVKPEDSLQWADVVCRSEGEYVLAELTDRIGLGQDWTDLRGCWVKRGDEVVRNQPRLLIPDLDVLPQPDLSSENKHYLGQETWVDADQFDSRQLGYDIMMVRGCPFECTFCIHNYTRKVTVGLGKYVRRRSVDHVLKELSAAVARRPEIRTIAISDDIFAPPRPWLEEFCARYKKEIGLPFLIWTFPRMVDESKIRLMKDAGLWACTMGIQSGSDRIRRECYERETSDEEIIHAAQIMADHGITRNLDFIGDNPYETDADKRATLNLLLKLPKPFYFNYFSLTYFPGVDLTERALRDGHIQADDVEDVAEKGYLLWAGTLSPLRSLDSLRWDVAYMMAVYRFPRWLVEPLVESGVFRRHVRRAADFMRGLRTMARWKGQVTGRLFGQLNFPSAS
jgi:anaerobic magnesium-protoporphyrin IX monomethyl ester cyclase